MVSQALFAAVTARYVWFADIVTTVDRAFVHMDYSSYNLPSHMQQDS